MKAIAMHIGKYLNDTKLIAQKISKDQYKNYSDERYKVDKILEKIEDIQYIEKRGPFN